MSLFQCEECGGVENTACCNYVLNTANKKPRVCSACDPLLKKWHNRFMQCILPKGLFKTNKVGNLEHIETGDTNYRKYQIMGTE